jgi:hypothetical protein
VAGGNKSAGSSQAHTSISGQQLFLGRGAAGESESSGRNANNAAAVHRDHSQEEDADEEAEEEEEKENCVKADDRVSKITFSASATAASASTTPFTSSAPSPNSAVLEGGEEKDAGQEKTVKGVEKGGGSTGDGGDNGERPNLVTNGSLVDASGSDTSLSKLQPRRSSVPAESRIPRSRNRQGNGSDGGSRQEESPTSPPLSVPSSENLADRRSPPTKIPVRTSSPKTSPKTSPVHRARSASDSHLVNKELADIPECVSPPLNPEDDSPMPHPPPGPPRLGVMVSARYVDTMLCQFSS